ncbi:MAG: septum formation initiator family protein [Acidobacteria bacterium]|nr:MAG: septum formation initiator family protein [Acidobacteriota bacterium]REK02087.1 MAG: septum formation initiator family protein [Acidobacteriota bacterium]REK15045.1 MAG: septum formation initiator family protein [Acidobacteriota bacterium]REK45759.1 MAG: septum formation initiator family protein [Acidobacteriota bacterium]
MALGVVIGTMTILCLAVNIRAFVEMNRQSIENQKLNTEIKQLNSTNLVLEEEIKNLKGDPKTIEREARKIGMSRPNEKILVPMN